MAVGLILWRLDYISLDAGNGRCLAPGLAVVEAALEATFAAGFGNLLVTIERHHAGFESFRSVLYTS